MGIFADYLDAGLGANIVRLNEERKKQLARIGAIRKRDVLVYAVDVTKGRSPININYQDLLPFEDQLSNLHGEAIDLILETPGGSGETAEDLVKMLRGKYTSVAVIVPGMAKSAGTLIAMAADEILMSKTSALGPIDAQISWQGKQFSAHALLEGMNKIKAEVTATNTLNRAYVPHPPEHFSRRTPERPERARLRARPGDGMAGLVQVQGMGDALEHGDARHRRRQEAPGEGNRRQAVRPRPVEDPWTVDQDR